ncbi:MAG: hypothetical protein ACM3XS_00330 [Bacteroidota bacterium]
MGDPPGDTSRCGSRRAQLGPSAGPVYLKEEVSGQTRRFYFRRGDCDWCVAGAVEDARFMSDEGGTDYRFTGTMVGLFAVGEETRADFDWFRYEPG